MKRYLSLVKFSHTVFAMPFALLSFTLAVARPEASFTFWSLLWVLLCMVFARNTAMSFNRWADRDMDALNPRTATRELPSGQIPVRSAGWFVAANAILFVVSAFMLNPLCGFLAPVALAVIMGYSYTKRFTAFCHFVLGLALALAPVGAWIAVTGTFDAFPIALGIMVLLWVSGFDIIYALQDIEFDKAHDLHSIPVAVGAEGALLVSRWLHAICAGTLLMVGLSMTAQFAATGWMSWVGILAFIALLVYQHTQVRPGDLSRVNLAFFTSNGVGSLVLGTLIILDQVV